MPEKEMELSEKHSSDCDLFIALGSSLQVTPASYFPTNAMQVGAKLILINQDETPIDNKAHLRFFEGIGETFPPMVEIALKG